MNRLEKATLAPLGAGPSTTPAGPTFAMQFNPTSLRLQVTNNVDGGKNVNRTAEQSTGESSDTLTVELLFDTADEGTTDKATSVRTLTAQVMRFVRAKPGKGKGGQTAPRVQFAWGDFCFSGVMTSYSEDIDLFSSQGIPLRAKVQVTILGQDPSLESLARGPGSNTGDGSLPPGGVALRGGQVQHVDRIATALGGETAPGLAARLGLPPEAWRGLDLGPVSPAALPAGHEVGFSEELSAALGLGLRTGVEAGLGKGLAERLGLPPMSDPMGAASTLLAAAGVPAADAAIALSAAGGVRAAIQAVRSEDGRLAVVDALRAFDAPLQAIAARADGTPPRADARAESYGRGVPLRAIVSGAAGAAAGVAAVLGAPPRSDGAPATRDPGEAPWQALPAASGGGGG